MGVALTSVVTQLMAIFLQADLHNQEPFRFATEPGM